MFGNNPSCRVSSSAAAESVSVDARDQVLYLMHHAEAVFKARVCGRGVDVVDHAELLHPSEPLEKRAIQVYDLLGPQLQGAPDSVVDLLSSRFASRGERVEVWA